MNEEWRGIATAPGYEVSNLGRVRREKTGRVLSPVRAGRGTGHLTVMLGRRQRRYIHALVLEAFVSPRPDGAITRHLDGDVANNRVENLAWGTVQENHADAIRHGRTTRGEKDPQAKLTSADVLAIREARKAGVPLKVLAERYGVREPCISRAATGKRWAHL